MQRIFLRMTLSFTQVKLRTNKRHRIPWVRETRLHLWCCKHTELGEKLAAKTKLAADHLSHHHATHLLAHSAADAQEVGAAGGHAADHSLHAHENSPRCRGDRGRHGSAVECRDFAAQR